MKKLNNNILFIESSVYRLVHKKGQCPNKETTRVGDSTFRQLYQSWDDRKKLFFKCQ